MDKSNVIRRLTCFLMVRKCQVSAVILPPYLLPVGEVRGKKVRNQGVGGVR